jgi:hypothetical protein
LRGRASYCAGGGGRRDRDGGRVRSGRKGTLFFDKRDERDSGEGKNVKSFISRKKSTPNVSDQREMNGPGSNVGPTLWAFTFV